MTVAEASAGLGDAISHQNGQKWLTCLAVMSQVEDMAHILCQICRDMKCGVVIPTVSHDSSLFCCNYI